MNYTLEIFQDEVLMITVEVSQAFVDASEILTLVADEYHTNVIPLYYNADINELISFITNFDILQNADEISVDMAVEAVNVSNYLNMIDLENIYIQVIVNYIKGHHNWIHDVISLLEIFNNVNYDVQAAVLNKLLVYERTDYSLAVKTNVPNEEIYLLNSANNDLSMFIAESKYTIMDFLPTGEFYRTEDKITKVIDDVKYVYPEKGVFRLHPRDLKFTIVSSDRSKMLSNGWISDFQSGKSLYSISKYIIKIESGIVSGTKYYISANFTYIIELTEEYLHIYNAVNQNIVLSHKVPKSIRISTTTVIMSPDENFIMSYNRNMENINIININTKQVLTFVKDSNYDKYYLSKYGFFGKSLFGKLKFITYDGQNEIEILNEPTNLIVGDNNNILGSSLYNLVYIQIKTPNTIEEYIDYFFKDREPDKTSETDLLDEDLKTNYQTSLFTLPTFESRFNVLQIQPQPLHYQHSQDEEEYDRPEEVD